MLIIRNLNLISVQSWTYLQNEFKARDGYQSFDPLLHARFFGLRIHAWRRHQCLNMELYVCESRD